MAGVGESGDWLICMRIFGLAVGASRGVEKAPVDCFCSFSKSSCSSLGRRGGAGPDLKDEVRRVDVLNARRERRRGSRDDIAFMFTCVDLGLLERTEVGGVWFVVVVAVKVEGEDESLRSFIIGNRAAAGGANRSWQVATEVHFRGQHHHFSSFEINEHVLRYVLEIIEDPLRVCAYFCCRAMSFARKRLRSPYIPNARLSYIASEHVYEM